MGISDRVVPVDWESTDKDFNTTGDVTTGNLTVNGEASISSVMDVGNTGVSGNYESLLINHGASSGGGYFVQRSGGDKFVGLSAFEGGDGSKRLFYGGAGWGVHDVNQHLFYTDPNSPTTSINGGILRMSIDKDGDVSIENDLSVGTDSLFVDTTNDRVGIGTNSPSGELHISRAGSPRIFFENTTSKSFNMRVDGSGNWVIGEVGIADLMLLDTLGFLTVSGGLIVDTDTLFVDGATDRVGINKANPTVALDVVGDIHYTGIISDVSDKRLKQNIEYFEDGHLEKICSIDTAKFEMKDNLGTEKFGVIAQELEKIYPSLVVTADDKDKTKSVNYIGLITPIIKAIQEQNRNIKELTDKKGGWISKIMGRK